MTESIDTSVIGDGPAGLAMSYHLSQRGREHVVLERGRVAERWRNERWEGVSTILCNWIYRMTLSSNMMTN
jgi:putative flavoprotein involved in K+ transport